MILYQVYQQKKLEFLIIWFILTHLLTLYNSHTFIKYLIKALHRDAGGNLSIQEFASVYGNNHPSTILIFLEPNFSQRNSQNALKIMINNQNYSFFPSFEGLIYLYNEKKDF